jgi:hypothetical protein
MPTSSHFWAHLSHPCVPQASPLKTSGFFVLYHSLSLKKICFGGAMRKQLSSNEREDFYSEKVFFIPSAESPVFIYHCIGQVSIVEQTYVE